ncbi:YczE/YyaS/YitT family protein [Sutcliffiella cohnii]
MIQLYTTFKAYSVFLVSIFLMGLGISLVTLAYLGTTAITSTPYVLSLFTPLSFGMYTMLFNTMYVLIQILLLKGDFPKIQYLQLLVGPVLGYSIDFWSPYISLIEKPNYFFQLAIVLVGCVIIAISIVIQLRANVVNNPAEGVVKAIALKVNKNFGTVKVCFDVSLVVIAVLISVVALGSISGIREGTVISAVIIGLFVKWTQNLSIRNSKKRTSVHYQ